MLWTQHDSAHGDMGAAGYGCANYRVLKPSLTRGCSVAASTIRALSRSFQPMK
jgi:hypothetical protein